MTVPAPRALAPDLARGVMLLAIAGAHAPLFVLAVDHGPGPAYNAAVTLNELFMNNHARPMFAFLFGYALVQMLDRRVADGSDPADVRSTLRRRGWWLLAFGLAHSLLVPIDILTGYGIASLLLVGLLWARSRTLLWTAGLTMVPAVLFPAIALGLALSQGVSFFDTAATTLAVPAGADPGALYLERLQRVPLVVGSVVVLVVPGVVAGMWAARHRLLEEPEPNHVFLLRFAVLATAASVAGALPSILVQTGAWSAPSAAALWGAALLQPLTGYIGGIGMAGIVALVAIRAARTRGPLTVAVQALGQRSLTFYLAQSVVFVAVFSPLGLGLQDHVGMAGAFGVAAVTWLASLVVAELMRRGGHRGPAEHLLRRLTRVDRSPARRKTPSA